MSPCVVILTTAPSSDSAQRITSTLLENRAVACVNELPGMKSSYWWKGKIEKSAEILLLCKTTRSKIGAVKKWIAQCHPYEVPEVLVLDVSGGADSYLRWIQQSVKEVRTKTKSDSSRSLPK